MKGHPPPTPAAIALLIAACAARDGGAPPPTAAEPLPAATVSPEPAAASDDRPADLGAIAAAERALHPRRGYTTGADGGVAGRVVDFRGRPIAGATVQLCCEGSAALPVLHTDADGRWATDRPLSSNTTIEVLATGWSRAAFTGPTEAVLGTLTLHRGPRQLAALAALGGSPTDRVWLALELAAGDAEGEDGPTDRGGSYPDQVQEDTWRAAARYLPELRLIAAEPAFDEGSYHLRDAARGLLALRARPEDDALVAPVRHPPATPVRAPTAEALCPPWQRAWAGSQHLTVEELPGTCRLRLLDREAGVALLSLDMFYADWGYRLDGIGRREGEGWALIDAWEATTWHGAY